MKRGSYKRRVRGVGICHVECLPESLRKWGKRQLNKMSRRRGKREARI